MLVASVVGANLAFDLFAVDEEVAIFVGLGKPA
jgi:hypothetical protein